jgi:hypothetical protein
MKKIFVVITLLLVASATLFAQVPQSFNYQAAVRNAGGNVIANTTVSFQFAIRDLTPGGTVLYQETHVTSTNEFGLVSLEVGDGTIVSGAFNTIPWGVGNKYLEVGIDTLGGTAFDVVGTPQLLSVPYALYAGATSSGSSPWTVNVNDIYNNNTGNVGIGITAPLYTLSIMDSTNAIIGVGSFDFNQIGSGRLSFKEDVTYNEECGFWFQHNGDLNELLLDAGCPTGDSILKFHRSGGMEIYRDVRIGSAATADNQLSVTGNADITGNVGIGAITPARKLEVSSNDSVYIRVTTATNDDCGIEFLRPGVGNADWRFVNAGGTYFILQNTSDNIFAPPSLTNNEFFFTTSAFRPNPDNDKSLGTTGNRWTVVYAVNGTINTSDAREKSNITDLNYGIAEVMKLRPVSFTWKDKPQDGYKLGFVAQEVEPILKEVVKKEYFTEETENGVITSDEYRYGIYYSDIIPVLTKAIQEQQAQIEKLTKMVEELQKNQK